MNPMPDDEEDAVAALLRATYGGDVNVEVTHDGLTIRVHPARGGSVHARISGVNSPVLTALLGAARAASTTDPGDAG